MCGDPCSCLHCDDGNVCTIDGCTAGLCWHEPLCDEVCCPTTGSCCPYGTNCCANGTCCAQVCDACLNSGSLTGGVATVDHALVCLYETLTFQVAGVVDTGGQKRQNCSLVNIPPNLTITWTILKPDGSTYSGVGPVASIAANLPGSYSCTFHATADRDCPPGGGTFGPVIGSVIPLDITGQHIDQDDPTNAGWASLAKGDPIYGGSEASTADNVKLMVSPPYGAVASISWAAEGFGSGSYNAPPSGPSATTWDLGDILNPSPGDVDFTVRVTYASGDRQCGDFASKIGVRTDDVIVVGWINGAGVTLPIGAAPYWTGVFPATGPPVPSSYDCNTAIGELTECDITPKGQNITTVPTAPADRDHILYWMFKYAANADPSLPSVVPGGDFRDSSDTHIDESKVTAFNSTPTNFKLFSRLKIKYFDVNWCSTPPTVLKGVGSNLIGTTVNPCGAFFPAPGQFPGQAGPAILPPQQNSWVSFGSGSLPRA